MDVAQRWRIEAEGCEVFTGADARASENERAAALESLPVVLARLLSDPLSGAAATDGGSALQLSSREYDIVVDGRVVPGLTLVYYLVPDERRVVIRRIKLLPALDTEAESPHKPVGVVQAGGAYREPVSNMVGKNVAVAVSDFDTRDDDCACNLMDKPRFFQVFSAPRK